MDQPYALFKDSRNSKVYAVPADRQSKRETSGAALLVDHLNLQNHGWDDTEQQADNEYLHAWLDSVPDA